MRAERNGFDRAAMPGFRRTRRLRRSAAMRELVRETSIGPGDFIQPLFVTHGAGVRREIGSMPGQFQFSVDQLPREIAELAEVGVKAVLLFCIPEEKDREASGAFAPDGVVQRALRTIKREMPEMLTIGDVCGCEYTDHGHCGVLDGCEVDNDRTVDLLVRIAVSQADAGADIVAPSDMMDGRVQAIREALEANGLSDVMILSYAAKYASAFYGPYRDAVGSAKALTGDKKTYQMDYANSDEALREVAMDISEGADAVMVKPGMLYLDIVRRVSETFKVPTFAYQVSGEYSMMRAAMANGWLDEERAILESLHAFKRAGAAGVLSYFAPQAARLLGR